MTIQGYDQKYERSGYFGFENVGTPEGSEPGILSEREKLAITKNQESSTSLFRDDRSSFDEGWLVSTIGH